MLAYFDIYFGFYSIFLKSCKGNQAMKKSLLATAIATAIAAPTANAGVVVYGKIHASIDYLDTSWYSTAFLVEPVTGGSKAWYVANRASRIGFKGTEDLGNGLSLIWKAETTYNLSESGDGWGGGRNAYIGLTGDWGTFLYGRHDTPMKISTGRLDLFSDQIGDYNFSDDPQNALLGPGFHDVRAGNAIAYISPNWNGFTFAAAIVPGENNSMGSDGLADGYSVAAMYSNNGLYLSAAYEEIKDLDLEPHKKWRVGAGYTINAFTVNAVYENQESKESNVIWTSSQENDVWQISGAYDFGNNRIKAAYGENSGEWRCRESFICLFAPDHNEKIKAWAVGIDHKLSKRTTAYAVYADNDYSRDPVYEEWGDDANQQISGFSMGMIHNF